MYRNQTLKKMTWKSCMLSSNLQKSISPTFYKQLLCQLSFAKTLQTQNVSTGKLCKTILYKQLLVKFLAKKYKPKPLVQKSCLKEFHTKKLLVKCWWNWHLEICPSFSIVDVRWSYSEIAAKKMTVFTSSKQWTHFRRSVFWPPTSTIRSLTLSRR